MSRSDKFWASLAMMVPKPLAFWCALRVFSNATTGKWSNQEVPALTVAEMFERWK